MLKWHKRYMDLANHVASWSKDPDKQVGAVIVSPDKRQYCFGYNGLPANIIDKPWILKDKAKKNSLTIHAEANALYNARQDVVGWTLVCNTAPCLPCCLVIVQKEIATVVSAPIDPKSSWNSSQNAGARLLQEANIEIIYDDHN